MMQTLRYEVLGKERFDHAFREYLRAWAFKHPTPADFFRLMRDASGMDLDWFWRDWIYTTARLDQAVDSVGTADGDPEGLPVEPRHDDVAARDGPDLCRRNDGAGAPPGRDVESRTRFAYRVRGGGQVTDVVVDPRAALPDIDRKNNTARR